MKADGKYISREAALKYIKSEQCKTCSDIGLCGNCAVLVAVKLLAKVPAADVAEVVRCKDCEYAERYERTNGTAGYYCGHPKNRFTYGERWDRVFKPVKEANDFCSYGEYQTNMGGVTNE